MTGLIGTEPLEVAVLSVLAATCRHGMDSEIGVQALDRGVRELLARFRTYEVVGFALAGWAGMISATAEQTGLTTDQCIALYAQDGEDRERTEPG